MSKRKLTLTLSFTVELEIDARMTEEIMKFALGQALEMRDGRHNFSTEMAARGVHDMAATIAAQAQFHLGCRIADKYPGVSGRGYMIAERLGEGRVLTYYPKVEVRVCGVWNDETFYVAEDDGNA